MEWIGYDVEYRTKIKRLKYRELALGHQIKFFVTQIIAQRIGLLIQLKHE